MTGAGASGASGAVGGEERPTPGAYGELVEVVVRIAAADEDLAAAALLDVAPGGFRCDPVLDPMVVAAAPLSASSPLGEPLPGVDYDEVELGVYVAPGDAAGVVPALRAAGVEPRADHVAEVEAGWHERWKEFHHSVVEGNLWVGPPWQLDKAPTTPGLRRVVIEPGQGFGTGAHPTTRLVLRLLQRERVVASVLDVGCGSGVLAVAAATLGFGGIVAVDNDPVAITATRENLDRNAVRGVRVELVDATSGRMPAADLVLANLVLEPLVQLVPRLRTPRVLVSGLLRSQAELAAESFLAAGFVVRERVDLDGWVGLALDAVDPDLVPRTASVF